MNLFSIFGLFWTVTLVVEAHFKPYYPPYYPYPPPPPQSIFPQPPAIPLPSFPPAPSIGLPSLAPPIESSSPPPLIELPSSSLSPFEAPPRNKRNTREGYSLLCDLCVQGLTLVEGQLNVLEHLTREDLGGLADFACNLAPRSIPIVDSLCDVLRDNLIDALVKLVRGLQAQSQPSLACRHIPGCSVGGGGGGGIIPTPANVQANQSRRTG